MEAKECGKEAHLMQNYDNHSSFALINQLNERKKSKRFKDTHFMAVFMSIISE